MDSLASGGSQGRLCLGEACTTPNCGIIACGEVGLDVPLANIRAMYEAFREYGTCLKHGTSRFQGVAGGVMRIQLMAAIFRAESPRQCHCEMRSAAGVLGQYAATATFGLSPM